MKTNEDGARICRKNMDLIHKENSSQTAAKNEDS